MSEVNGNGQKLQKAAESALTQVAARWLIITGMPAMFALSLYFGNAFVGRVDAAIQEMREGFKDDRERIHGLDTRLTGAERDIEYLKAR